MKNNKNGKGKAKKILGCIAAVIVLITVVTLAVNLSLSDKIIKLANTFETVEIENQLVPEKDANGYYTFTTDENFKVVQITDVHIGGGWMSAKKDEMALNAVAAMIKAEKPDLVIATGDIAYPVPFQAGTFNNLTGAKTFAALMEKLGVYWTVCFGNHDTESYSYFNREKISDFYANSGFKYCLYQPGPEDVDGYGNYVINIKNTKGELTQALFIMDSHSYLPSDPFGLFWKYDNFHDNQVAWYEEAIENLTVQNGGKPFTSSLYMHIPLTEHKDAWFEYYNNGKSDTENVKFISGDAGEDEENMVYCGVGDDRMFEAILEKNSTKAVFVGHDHKNNFMLEYKGVTMSYSMSIDYLAYIGISKEGIQRGCTVINYAPDGEFEIIKENYYQDKYPSQYEKEQVTMTPVE
ncbi:MAG: metallophosphoesterase [Clostridia bacterium]|nr:metallophosphoesterase [Clostridia bacterium]